MDIYMARNPTTRNGLVPLWDIVSWYFDIVFEVSSDDTVSWHSAVPGASTVSPTPSHTFSLPSSSPPPEYSSLPDHDTNTEPEFELDDDDADANETNENDGGPNIDYNTAITTTTQTPNTSTTTTTTSLTTAAGVAITTNPINPSNQHGPLGHHLQVLANDLSTMSEYNAINLDNYCNYIREINDVNTNGNRRRIDNTNYSSSSYY